jgi:hypothetical protein
LQISQSHRICKYWTSYGGERERERRERENSIRRRRRRRKNLICENNLKFLLAKITSAIRLLLYNS